jgi:hypothetical protein
LVAAVAVTVAVSPDPGNGWRGVTRLYAWCENPPSSEASHDGWVCGGQLGNQLTSFGQPVYDFVDNQLPASR